MDNRFGFGKAPQAETTAVRTAPWAVSKSNAFLRAVWGWMGMGLGITGVLSWLIGNNDQVFDMIAPMMMPLIFVELGLVLFLSFRVHKMAPQTATAAFLGYAALNGIVLSTIFQIYELPGISTAFFATAGTFGAMTVYGITTKRDLTEWRSFLMMGLWGIIIASIVNLFVASSAIYWFVTYAGVLVFTGLTAWDTQKIMKLGAQIDMNDSRIRNMAIMGALALYLDFINLFLMMLRIFGGSRN